MGKSLKSEPAADLTLLVARFGSHVEDVDFVDSEVLGQQVTSEEELAEPGVLKVSVLLRRELDKYLVEALLDLNQLLQFLVNDFFLRKLSWALA